MMLRALLLIILVFGWSGLLTVPAGESAAAETDVGKLMSELAAYRSGQSLAPVREIESRVAQSAGAPELRKRLENGLAQVLAGPAAAEAKRFVCQQLAIIGTDDSLPAIAALLKSDDTVALACTAFGRRPSVKADQALREALGRLHAPARVEVINALGDRLDTKAVPLLATFTHDSETEVAVAAVTALGKIADSAARQAIAALRKAGNPALADAVTEASLRVAEKLTEANDRTGAAAIYEDLLEPSQPNYVRRGALKALLQLDSDGGEQRILRILRDPDETLKPVAIAGIVPLRSANASEVFGQELTKLPSPDQVLLIEALASRGDPPARHAITDRVLVPELQVRLAAIGAMSTLGDAATVPVLVSTLAKTTTAEEIQAIDLTLTRLSGGKLTDEAIIKELTKVASTTEARLIAVLAKRHSRMAVPVLLAETKSANLAVARAAFRALGTLAEADDVPALFQGLLAVTNSQTRPAAEDAVARILRKVPDAARRSSIICPALSRASDPEVQCSLIRLLPVCGEASSLVALKAALANANPQVKDTAVRALADWPDAAAGDLLLDLYRQSESGAYQALTLRALVRLEEEGNARPEPALFARYRQLLATARNDDDRKLILGALAQASRPEALELAVPLLANSAVRPEAELAVRKIAEAIKAQYPKEAAEALQRLKVNHEARP